jgi:hypothetical protein
VKASSSHTTSLFTDCYSVLWFLGFDLWGRFNQAFSGQQLAWHPRRYNVLKYSRLTSCSAWVTFVSDDSSMSGKVMRPGRSLSCLPLLCCWDASVSINANNWRRGLVVLGIKPCELHILVKWSTTELHSHVCYILIQQNSNTQKWIKQYRDCESTMEFHWGNPERQFRYRLLAKYAIDPEFDRQHYH